MKVIIFDLDDTLSNSKLPIDKEMSSLITALLNNYTIAIVSGCNYYQFEQQLLPYLEPEAKLQNLFLFPANATQMYLVYPKPVQLYKENLDEILKHKIIKAIKLATTGIDIPWEDSYGEIIEDRGSQITFSALGQEAPINLKNMWDTDRKKRTAICRRLLPLLPECDTSLGGKTSIDIFLKGRDKSYAAHKLENMGFNKSEMLFIGDALFEGGNDYPMKKAGVECIEVSEINDTKKIIKLILSETSLEYDTGNAT